MATAVCKIFKKLIYSLNLNDKFQRMFSRYLQCFVNVKQLIHLK